MLFSATWQQYADCLVDTFKSFFKVLISPTQRTELSWFISKARVEPFFIGCFLAVSLKPLPRAWMLTPVWLILLSRGYHHPSGTVSSPCLNRSISWLWGEGLPQHHPNTLNTEDPFQTHWEKSLPLPPLWLRALLTATAWRGELARQRILKSWVICIRMEATANQEDLGFFQALASAWGSEYRGGIGLPCVMLGCLWDRIVSVLCVQKAKLF